MKRSFSLRNQLENSSASASTAQSDTAASASTASQSPPTLNLNYDIDLVQQEINSLVNDLKTATKDTPKTDPVARKQAVQNCQASLEAKYPYTFNKCKKLFHLAFDYFSNCLNVAEFRSIFEQFVVKIKQLQLESDPNSQYTSTSEQIGRFVGRKFNVPES